MKMVRLRSIEGLKKYLHLKEWTRWFISSYSLSSTSLVRFCSSEKASNKMVMAIFARVQLAPKVNINTYIGPITEFVSLRGRYLYFPSRKRNTDDKLLIKSLYSRVVPPKTKCARNVTAMIKIPKRATTT